MGIQCWWSHTRKRWSYEYENFEKVSVEKLRYDHGGRELSFCLWSQRVELSNVASAVKFFGSRPAERNWDLRHPKMRRAWGGVRGQHSKNCVSLSLHVSKIWSQKFINRSYVKRPEVPSGFVYCVVCICICIRVVYNTHVFMLDTLKPYSVDFDGEKRISIPKKK